MDVRCQGRNFIGGSIKFNSRKALRPGCTDWGAHFFYKQVSLSTWKRIKAIIKLNVPKVTAAYLLLRSDISGSKEPVRVDTQLIGYAAKENASSNGNSVRGSIYLK